jgi:hypothetical protein
MRRKWEKGDFVYFSSHNFLLELSALCGLKKPPKKPHGVRAYTSEPEASAPGVALKKNHGKDGKHRKGRSRMGDVLRAGNVSVRSWGEGHHGEHRAHGEEGKGKREKSWSG